MKRNHSWQFIILAIVVTLTLALIGQGRLWGQKAAPQAALLGEAPSYQFALELNGQVIGTFDKCKGLVSSSDVFEEIKITGPGLQVAQKRPGGMLIWEDLTLTRSAGASDPALWEWRRTIEEGNWGAGLRAGAVVLYGPGGHIGRWEFTNAWPVRLSIDESVERVTLAHDGLRYAGPVPSTPTRGR